MMESATKTQVNGNCKAKRAKTKKKRKISQSDEDSPAFLSSKYAKPPCSKIYNSHFKKSTPAELFRKDLISAMKLPDSEPLNADEFWLIDDPWKPEWEKGVQVPVEPDALPEPNVIETRKKNKDIHIRLPKKLIHVARDQNYNPDIHFLCYTEKFSDEVCRYDLDDVDAQWLTVVNEDREVFGLQPIDEIMLEKIIETLEDLCHENMQEALKSEYYVNVVSDEDAVCDVCRSPDSEDGNEIVFCDACNLSVHQSCYGITKIPEGSWICRTCALNVRPLCALCPNRGGAMKPTKYGDKWCHVSCAIWVPEVSIGCVEKMEPVTKLSHIPIFRTSLVCVLCQKKYGACIQCSAKSCRVPYHVTCAFKARLRMRAIMGEGDDDALKLKSYCLKHTKKDIFLDSDSEEVNRREIEMTSEEKYSVKEDNRLLEKEPDFFNYTSIYELKTALQKYNYDRDILEAVFYYWKLKRRANFNQPLLHPKEVRVSEETSNDSHNFVERIVQFRQDLERARNLCYMVNKREKMMRHWIKLKEDIFFKQSEVLTSNSMKLSKEEYSAILIANHGDLAYDKAHSGVNSPSPLLLKVLNSLIGEEMTKVELNGMLKMRKKRESNSLKKLPNPYAKHYLNGLLKRSQRWLASMDQQKWESTILCKNQESEMKKNMCNFEGPSQCNDSDDFELDRNKFVKTKNVLARETRDSIDETSSRYAVESRVSDISYMFDIRCDSRVSKSGRNSSFSTEFCNPIDEQNSNDAVFDDENLTNMQGISNDPSFKEPKSADPICSAPKDSDNESKNMDHNFNFGNVSEGKNKTSENKKLSCLSQTVFSEKSLNNCSSKTLNKLNVTDNQSLLASPSRKVSSEKSNIGEFLSTVDKEEASAHSLKSSEDLESDDSDTDIYQFVANEMLTEQKDTTQGSKENEFNRNNSGCTRERKEICISKSIRRQKQMESFPRTFFSRKFAGIKEKTESLEKGELTQHRKDFSKKDVCYKEKLNKGEDDLSSPIQTRGDFLPDFKVIEGTSFTNDDKTILFTSQSFAPADKHGSSRSESLKNIGDKTDKSPNAKTFTTSKIMFESKCDEEQLPDSVTTIRKGSLTGYKIPKKKTKASVVEDDSSSGLKRGSSPLSPLTDIPSSLASSTSSSYSSSVSNRPSNFRAFNESSHHNHSHKYHSKHKNSSHKVHHGLHFNGSNRTESQLTPTAVIRQPQSSELYFWKQPVYHSQHKEVPGVHWRPLCSQRVSAPYHQRHPDSPLQSWTQQLRQPCLQRPPYGRGSPYV